MNRFLHHSVSCHAWNKDHTHLAVSPNNKEIEIYKAKSSDPRTWQLITTLRSPQHGHQLRVTGISWSHATNAIATSSHDRDVYVWTATDKTNKFWTASKIQLSIKRAALCVQWSPNGKKLAIGTGSKEIAICHFCPTQNIWVSKMINEAAESSILSVDFAPNNLFVIAGGSDCKCRVFSAYIDGVDNENSAAIGLNGGIDIMKARKFGSILAEFEQSKGWVESVVFSPSGKRFAWTGHDAMLHFGNFRAGGCDVQSVRAKKLPFTSVAFVSESIAIAVGYDYVPVLYEFDGVGWRQKGPVEEYERAGPKDCAIFSFNDICVYGDHRKQFTTSSIDGRVLFWDLNGKI